MKVDTQILLLSRIQVFTLAFGLSEYLNPEPCWGVKSVGHSTKLLATLTWPG